MYLNNTYKNISREREREPDLLDYSVQDKDLERQTTFSLLVSISLLLTFDRERVSISPLPEKILRRLELSFLKSQLTIPRFPDSPFSRNGDGSRSSLGVFPAVAVPGGELRWDTSGGRAIGNRNGSGVRVRVRFLRRRHRLWKLRRCRSRALLGI